MREGRRLCPYSSTLPEAHSQERQTGVSSRIFRRSGARMLGPHPTGERGRTGPAGPGEMGFRNLLQSRVLDRQTPRGTRSELIWTRLCDAAPLGALTALFCATPRLCVQRPDPSRSLRRGSPCGLLIPQRPPSSSACVSPLRSRSGCISKTQEHLAPKRPRQPDQLACRAQVSTVPMNNQTSVQPSLCSY